MLLQQTQHNTPVQYTTYLSVTQGTSAARSRNRDTGRSDVRGHGMDRTTAVPPRRSMTLFERTRLGRLGAHAYLMDSTKRQLTPSMPVLRTELATTSTTHRHCLRTTQDKCHENSLPLTHGHCLESVTLLRVQKADSEQKEVTKYSPSS